MQGSRVLRRERDERFKSSAMATSRQAISASYLSHEGAFLTFVSRLRPRQQALNLTLDIGDAEVRLGVLLKKARETNGGEFVCLAEIVEGSHRLSSPSVPSHAFRFLRSYPRTQARLRALSPALPSFRALSLDLSQGGLKLETEDRLLPGTRIPMTLDLEIPEQDPIPVTCRVVWCQATSKSFVVGLQFVDLEPWVAPLLESFQAWLGGSGLKPKPYRAEIPLEFPEPASNDKEEPRPPAGSISKVTYAHQQVELVLAWSRGEVFRVVFGDVLVFRDNRGVEGAAFYDALDLEDSAMKSQALMVLPVSLEAKRELFHYQFLSRHDRPILEVLCCRPADHQLLDGE